MKFKFFSIFALAFSLVGCGGGGSQAVNQVPPIVVGPVSSSSSSLASSNSISSSSNTATSSSSSSLSSLSATSYSASGNPNIQNVFVNSYDPLWAKLSVFEAKYDGTSFREVSDSNLATTVRWSTVSTTIAAQQSNVIDLEFLSGSSYNYAQARIFSAASNVNLSDFKTGRVEFDLKMIAYGNSVVPLKFELECGWPCVSKDHSISIPSAGLWYHQSIKVSDLVDDGLDLSKISVGFQIYPAWGNQPGFHFQVANIQWVKGATPLEKYCAEHRTTTRSLQLTAELISGSASPTSITTSNFVALKPGWATANDIVGYKMPVSSELKACAFIANNYLKTEFNFGYPYVHDGKLKMGYYFEDAAGKKAYFKKVPISININSAGKGEWQWLNAALNPYDQANNLMFEKVDTGFDPNSLTYIGFLLDANGKDPAINDQISMDNLLLIEPY